MVCAHFAQLRKLLTCAFIAGSADVLVRIPNLV